MMNRRFVNLVLENSTSNMYALHRLDVSKHLFYPSTAEAEAEAAAHGSKKTNNGGGGGGGKPKPLRIERLRRLPPPIAGFETSTSPATRSDWTSMFDDMFVLLHAGEPGGGRVFHANSEGQTSLYDTGTRSIVCVPDLGKPKGLKPLAFVIPAAGEEEEEEENLYVLRSSYDTDYHSSHSHNFEVLSATNHRCSINYEDLDYGGDVGGHLFDLKMNLNWNPLPAPPLFAGDKLVSSAVLDGGRTICVSSSMSNSTAGGGTFCFDTASREWRRAGEWTLPFYGRGEYVPELETWVGFTPNHPHHLCSADLTGVAMAGFPSRHGPAPLQHVWEDFTPPPTVVTARFPGNVVRRTWVEWMAEQLHMVRLGSGRLCIAKVFDADQEPEDTLMVLVGVEVVRGGDGGELRMVKHKTKRFVFPGNRINCIL